MKSNLPSFSNTNVLGYEVFSSSLDVIKPNIDKVLINTFSPNSYGLAKSDYLFEEALKKTDVLVLDGMGIAIGSILINGKNIKKIAGEDCFNHFMKLADQNRWRIFFMGSSEETLKKIKSRAIREYSNITVEFYSPPFKSEFTLEDNDIIVQSINDFEPDVLFVGLTAPKQEKWAYFHRDLVNARIISTIGNVFDWYAGNSKRPSKIWIKLRLEWFIRIFLRPEIFKRNTKNQMKFFKDVILHVLYIKKIK
ncbi:glycosyltransferase [Euzebyella marina]|uniref:Glycosyltransferase n=2 Tax=Euzebyella marina TaxID=1761453 RepID=A0A3G2LBH1_9FLAO|nr:glycosyltransferase [Euzebyella marina]